MTNIKRLGDDCCRVAAWLLLLLTACLLVGPLVVALAMSFDGTGYLSTFPPHQLSLRWYEDLFSDEYYRTGMLVSIELAVLTTLISVIAGTGVAIVLHRYEFPGKALLSAAFMAPVFIGGVVVGLSLLIFLSRLGVSSGFAKLLAGHVITTLPYTIRTALAGLAGISPGLEEAALTLGANERKAFFDITLPLAKTGIVAGAIFAFAFSMDEVSVSMFLTTPRVYTLPIALISRVRSDFNLTIAAAAVILIALTVLLITILDRLLGMNRLVGEGMHGG